MVTSVSTQTDPIGLNKLYAHIINYELRMEYNETSQQIGSSTDNAVRQDTRGVGVEDATFKNVEEVKAATLEEDLVMVDHARPAKFVARLGMMLCAATTGLVTRIKPRIIISLLLLLQPSTRWTRIGTFILTPLII